MHAYHGKREKLILTKWPPLKSPELACTVQSTFVAQFSRIQGVGGKKKNELEIVCVISWDKESDALFFFFFLNFFFCQKKKKTKKRKEKNLKKKKWPVPGFDPPTTRLDRGHPTSQAGYPVRTPRSVLSVLSPLGSPPQAPGFYWTWPHIRGRLW